MSHRHLVASSIAAVVALACWGVASVSRAGFVYELADYTGSQAGYHISGEVITDTNNGVISSSDILAWSLTVTGPDGVTVVGTTALHPAASVDVGVVGVLATPSGLYWQPISGGELFSLQGSNSPSPIGSADYDLVGTAAQSPPPPNGYWSIDLGTIRVPPRRSLWDSSGPTGSPPIAAAAPEPASLTLTLLGVGGLAAAGLLANRRRRYG